MERPVVKTFCAVLPYNGTRYMDSNECNTVIAAARNSSGKSTEELLQSMDHAASEFGKAAREKFGKKGEW